MDLKENVIYNFLALKEKLQQNASIRRLIASLGKTRKLLLVK